jgi:hypothetical protein
MGDLYAEAVGFFEHFLDGQSLQTDDVDGFLFILFQADDQYELFEEEFDTSQISFDGHPGLGDNIVGRIQVLGVVCARVDFPDEVVEAFVVVFVEGLVHADPLVELLEIESACVGNYLPYLMSIWAYWKMRLANLFTTCWMLMVFMS